MAVNIKSSGEQVPDLALDLQALPLRRLDAGVEFVHLHQSFLDYQIIPQFLPALLQLLLLRQQFAQLPSLLL
jgi:hypothetical protein